MPSPNGYLDTITASSIWRNWMRLTWTYDSTQSPWTGNGAGYSFQINIGTAALGPFAPATLTGPTECSASPGNPVDLGSTTSMVEGVGAPPGSPGALTPDTDYWIEMVVLDPADAEVDRWVQGPFHTEPFPTFTCLQGANTETTTTSTLG